MNGKYISYDMNYSHLIMQHSGCAVDSHLFQQNNMGSLLNVIKSCKVKDSLFLKQAGSVIHFSPRCKSASISLCLLCWLFDLERIKPPFPDFSSFILLYERKM